MSGPIEMTRQQLHELVWSKPMREAAESIPMSDLSFKKLCLKHQVPVPPRGYWNKSRASREAGKAPIPSIAMGDQRIWIRRFLQRRSTTTPLVQRATADLELEAPETSQNGTRRHECTRRTKKALRQATPDKRGALIATGVGVASINVAPETVARALAVWDDLARAVERLGHSVSRQSSPAAFVIARARVPVAVFEKFVRSEEPPDAAETMRRESYALRYPKFVKLMDFLNGWVWRPSGRLTVTVGEGDERGLQHRWADTASHRVESRIDEVAVEAVAHARVIKARRERIRQQVERRRLEEREGERRRQQELKKELEGHAPAIEQRADLFEQAQRVTRLVQRLRDMLEAEGHNKR